MLNVFSFISFHIISGASAVPKVPQASSLFKCSLFFPIVISCYHILDVRNGIDSQQVKNKMEGDFQRLRQKGKGGPVGEENINIKYNNEINAIDKDNTKFIKNQQQMIKESIADQDVQLNQLDLAVTRLHHIGIDIKEEGELQDKMLDNLKTDLDDAGDKMGVVMGSLSKLLKTKDGCQIWTIVILAVILIILVALIIWV